jgi:hypothetical protein
MYMLEGKGGERVDRCFWVRKRTADVPYDNIGCEYECECDEDGDDSYCPARCCARTASSLRHCGIVDESRPGDCARVVAKEQLWGPVML